MKRKGIFSAVLFLSLLLATGVGVLAKGPAEPEKPAEEVKPAGPEPEVSKYKEAPMLAEKVKAGELPPVEERLPKDILVVTPIERIGKYGGTIYAFALDPNMWNDLQAGAGLAEGLYRMNKEGNAIEVDVAKNWELSDDYMSFTIYLREGLKWSDGHPLTADDTMFWFMDMVKGPPGFSTWNPVSFRDAQKVDDLTVRLNFDDPNPQIVSQMASWPSWNMFMPKHFLQKWHITYNPDAEKIAKEEGYETWQQCFQSHFWWSPQQELDLPKMNPWILTERTSANLFWERNPYYFKVDTAGNQLPYIDRMSMEIVDQEVYNLKVITGEADYAYIGTTFENYTLYKENETSGDYRVVLMPGAQGSRVSFGFNLTYDDPVIRKVFQDKRFRQGMSVAIDRDEINKLVFYGQGVPRQSTVLPSVSYYREEWGKSYAQYDPRMANRLLDEVGMSKRDKDGFRMLPDGREFFIPIEFSGGDDVTKALEIIRDNWTAVGINTMLKYVEGSTFHEREDFNDHMLRVASTAFSSEMDNYSQGSRGFASSGDLINYCRRWADWAGAKENLETLTKQLASETDADAKAGLEERLAAAKDAFGGAVKVLPQGEEPPEEYLQVRKWFRDRTQYAIGSPQYMDISRKIFDWHAENLYSIGTVGMIPRPLIAKNRLRNVITSDYINRAILPFDVTGYFYQMYLEE